MEQPAGIQNWKGERMAGSRPDSAGCRVQPVVDPSSSGLLAASSAVGLANSGKDRPRKMCSELRLGSQDRAKYRIAAGWDRCRVSCEKSHPNH